MRKGQILGQVFIYVLAAVVFSLILLFGYRAVTNLTQRSEEVMLMELRHEVQTAVNSIASNPDVKKKSLQVPAKYKTVCFLGNITQCGATYDDTCLCKGAAPCTGANESDRNALICEAWKSGQKQNVFLWPMADIEIYVADIVLEDCYLCVAPVDGRIQLRLEGTGSATRIQQWT
jgi:hypothetical protein